MRRRTRPNRHNPERNPDGNPETRTAHDRQQGLLHADLLRARRGRGHRALHHRRGGRARARKPARGRGRHRREPVRSRLDRQAFRGSALHRRAPSRAPCPPARDERPVRRGPEARQVHGRVGRAPGTVRPARARRRSTRRHLRQFQAARCSERHDHGRVRREGRHPELRVRGHARRPGHPDLRDRRSARRLRPREEALRRGAGVRTAAGYEARRCEGPHQAGSGCGRRRARPWSPSAPAPTITRARTRQPSA